MLLPSRAPERTCCPPEARTYKSIVLLSLIICLRKGYAFEHLEQFTCTLYYVERYEKSEVIIPENSGQAAACTHFSGISL